MRIVRRRVFLVLIIIALGYFVISYNWPLVKLKLQTSDWLIKGGLVRPSSRDGQARSHYEADNTEQEAVKEIYKPRDLLWQEPWPEKQLTRQHNITDFLTVHYLWCGKGMFHFRDHLGVLSILRVLEPIKLVFHYNTLPAEDSYNNWFIELKTSVPQLVLKKGDCGSDNLLEIAAQVLTPTGGVVMKQGVILSRPPSDFYKNPVSVIYSNSSRKLQGMFFASKGFKEVIKMTNSTKTMPLLPHCHTIESFNNNSLGSTLGPCVTVTSEIHPEDIFAARTPFGELTRWLFYGRRAPLVVKQNPDNPIPRITHYIRLPGYGNDLRFDHFLNILSAVYVAGFEHVYIHAETTPQGRWWEELTRENITLVKVDKLTSVFQQNISVTQHKSDLMRFLILYKHGGAYQDFDVTWTSRVPDWLLTYPTVMPMDWPKYGNWPGALIASIILTRRHAPWLHHYLKTMRDYRDGDWGYNSLLMSYRTYELYPDTIFLDHHLQVICFNGICHPEWTKDLVKLSDKRAPLLLRKEDMRSVHVTWPKPHPAFKSVETLNNSTDVIAQIGKMILEKSGRKHLMK